MSTIAVDWSVFVQLKSVPIEVVLTAPGTVFIVDGNLAVGVIGGSARVLTTASSKASQGILCTAILTERANDPPLVMATLPVIRKNTQQGD